MNSDNDQKTSQNLSFCKNLHLSQYVNEFSRIAFIPKTIRYMYKQTNIDFLKATSGYNPLSSARAQEEICCTCVYKTNENWHIGHKKQDTFLSTICLFYK